MNLTNKEQEMLNHLESIYECETIVTDTSIIIKGKGINILIDFDFDTFTLSGKINTKDESVLNVVTHSRLLMRFIYDRLEQEHKNETV